MESTAESLSRDRPHLHPEMQKNIIMIHEIKKEMVDKIRLIAYSEIRRLNDLAEKCIGKGCEQRE